ncbi:hypothetical protein SAMN05444266_11389 [Chitinophaga jiangningensis]|uniref:Uncharacterized protein n=1 Tax=Chitinophaga jiangningensis TaxID=1419482 RepID=A0A1M7MIT4_9BACT|nr:hypothetical protein [Chitinophaga jiangningensis]SHM90802.1 hypothetical protein SAMN05444266_11389 [Chitinophaga jiangningensis]
MKTFFLTLGMICVMVVTYAQTSYYAPAHVGIVYPLSTNGTNAAKYTNRFSLHAIAGLSYGETGVIVSGFSSVIKDEAHGVQIAGFSNHIGHTNKAVTLAGFTNIIHQRADGITIAGFGNFVKQQMNGIQLAGFVNTAGNVNGLQIAGFANKAADTKLQIAGFINIAKKVKGVQLAGFINIADSSDYPIGIVNIIRNGEKQVSLSIDESATTIAAFKSGGRSLYGILGVGYNFKSEQNLYALQAGIGWHLPLLNRLRLNVEGTETILCDFKKGVYSKWTSGGYLAYRFGSRFEVFAGPNINFVHIKDGAGADLISNYIWSKSRSNNTFDGIFAGVQGGVQVRI